MASRLHSPGRWLSTRASIQHAGSLAAPTIAFQHPLRTLSALPRSRLWLAGGVLGIIGWAISIAALTQAPLSLVQAFLIGGIVLLAPVAVRVLGQRLTLTLTSTVGRVLPSLGCFSSTTHA